jgi:type I restriction enzyme, S subunit
MIKINSQTKTALPGHSREAKAGWRKVKLGEFASVNPSVNLQRGKEYPFLDMADVAPLSRTTNWQKQKVFNGSGARFERGDTLFARITPCLENGKITQAQELETPALGSTEFYVLRGKQGISDSDFVYYLSRTFRIRKLAEGSMVGASGRQRVERAAFENIETEVPGSVEVQKRIADILSAFDDKIELNNKISKNLEATAQAIFKEWFVNFRFPGREKVKMIDSELGKIPEWWEVKTLCAVADVQWGDTSITKALYIERGYPAYSASGPDGYREKYDFDRIGVVLSAIGANCGLTWLARDKWSAIKNTLRFWSTDDRISTEYLFLATRGKETWPQRGSAQPFIALGDARKRKILIPTESILGKFNDFLVGTYSKIDLARLENQKLAALRDLLLPKLMSGEIRV